MQKNIEGNSCYQISEHLFEALSNDTDNGAARQKALASVRQRTWGNSSIVTYQSDGNLLIVNRIDQGIASSHVFSIANDLAHAGIKITILTSDHQPDVSDPGSMQQLSRENVRVVTGELKLLTGFLGQFSVQADVFDEEHFDMVLDLGIPAYLQHEVLPPGYYAPGEDQESLRFALQEISQMVGEFGKPVYVNYQADICTHSNKGITGCMRCLDSCPARAIEDTGNKIKVNTSLCLGCGSCTATCPTGALSYTFPTIQQWLVMVRELLVDYGRQGGVQPDLLIYDEGAEELLLENAGILPDNVLPLPVEQVGSVGMDAWFSALAYGAGSITLIVADDTPETVRAGLGNHVSVAQSILNGMGYSDQRIRLLEINEDKTLLIDGKEREISDNNPAAGFVPFEKYRTVRMAINHLYQHAPDPQSLTGLPDSSPFGEIQVDRNTCTLCMSCVAVCPVQALQHDAEQLKLSFIETNCVQCGLCCNICPEDSITLASRYVYDDEFAGKPRLLNEDTPFCCITCGKPFISQRMFDKIAQKLADTGNWSVSDEVTPDWLKMCGDCRARESRQ